MASRPIHQRALRTLKYYFGGILRMMNVQPVFLWAQAIAFKVLVTIVPVLFLAVAILSSLLRREDAFSSVATFIQNFLPPYNSSQFIQALEQLQSASYTLTIIGIAGLLFSAMTLFSTLRVVVDNIFQEDWHESRGVIIAHVFDLRMAAQVGLLLVLSLALTTAMQTFNREGVELMQTLGLDYRWLTVGWRRLITALGLFLPFVITSLMFWQLYYFIPKPHPPKRSAALGAVTAALLWEIAKNAFTLYATNIARFERYQTGQAGENAIQGLGDTFGIIIAFVFWVYFSGIILVIGGLTALLHEKRRRTRITATDPEQSLEPTDGRAERPTEPEPSEA